MTAKDDSMDLIFVMPLLVDSRRIVADTGSAIGHAQIGHHQVHLGNIWSATFLTV
jgi:hypothetical protein